MRKKKKKVIRSVYFTFNQTPFFIWKLSQNFGNNINGFVKIEVGYNREKRWPCHGPK